MAQEIQFVIEQEVEETGIVNTAQLAQKIKAIIDKKDGWIVHQVLSMEYKVPYSLNQGMYLIIKNRYLKNES